MSKELKPCPWCGTKPKLTGVTGVCCPKCGASKNTEKEWQTRALREAHPYVEALRVAQVYLVSCCEKSVGRDIALKSIREVLEFAEPSNQPASGDQQ